MLNLILKEEGYLFFSEVLPLGRFFDSFKQRTKINDNAVINKIAINIEIIIPFEFFIFDEFIFWLFSI